MGKVRIVPDRGEILLALYTFVKRERGSLIREQDNISVFQVNFTGKDSIEEILHGIDIKFFHIFSGFGSPYSSPELRK